LSGFDIVLSLPRDHRPLQVYTGLDPVLRSSFRSLFIISPEAKEYNCETASFAELSLYNNKTPIIQPNIF
jgi:hypothetical protein